MDTNSTAPVTQRKPKRGKSCENLSFAAKEAFKRLRTNLVMSFPREDTSCHLIGITSAQPSDGKSTISLNLAYSLAELGKRTLLIDADGIYNPNDFNDRLLLGLKGTMSEAELHFLQERMRGGLMNKARRGELRKPLPIGYLYDDCGRTVKDDMGYDVSADYPFCHCGADMRGGGEP